MAMRARALLGIRKMQKACHSHAHFTQGFLAVCIVQAGKASAGAEGPGSGLLVWELHHGPRAEKMPLGPVTKKGEVLDLRPEGGLLWEFSMARWVGCGAVTLARLLASFLVNPLATVHVE